MIVYTAFGKEKMVHRFLEQWWNVKDTEIDAWYKYKFDPKHIFLKIEDNQIVSMLQYSKRTLVYKGKRSVTSAIEFALTAQFERNQGHFKSLLDAFCEKASCNDLFSVAKCENPKVLASQPFQEETFMKEYTLPSFRVEQKPYSRTRKYRPSFDLYPLYELFMSHFDGSIVLDRAQFESELAYLHAAKKKIDIMYDDHYEPNGLAIYTVHEQVIRIEHLIYLNSDALESLFSNLSIISDRIYIMTSQHECLERLYPNLKWKKKKHILIRNNNPKLFTSLTHESKEDAFKHLNGPMWYGLL